MYGVFNIYNFSYLFRDEFILEKFVTSVFEDSFKRSEHFFLLVRVYLPNILKVTLFLIIKT